MRKLDEEDKFDLVVLSICIPAIVYILCKFPQGIFLP